MRCGHWPSGAVHDSCGHIPPIRLAFIRWTGAFLILLPFAALHLLRDWPTIR